MHFALAPASALLLASSTLAVPAGAPMAKRDNVQTREVLQAPIYLHSKKSDSVFTPRFARFNGNRETDNGRQYLVMGGANSHTLAGEAFKFVAVESSYLGSSGAPYQFGYPIGSSGGNAYPFGLLQSTKNPDFCVAAHKLDQQTRFDAMPCVYANDASIEPYIFSLRALPQTFNNGPVNYTSVITFEGNHARSGSSGSYSFMPGTTDTVNLVAVPTENYDYELIMSPKIGTYYPTTRDGFMA